VCWNAWKPINPNGARCCGAWQCHKCEGKNDLELAIAGPRQRTGYQFEDALLVCALGWVVPNLICMWIPETLLAPLGVEWPQWLEIPRLMVVPVLWQTALVTVGLRTTHQIGWIRAILIGLLSVVVFFVMFLAFMR
jgi:hypothetical protein